MSQREPLPIDVRLMNAMASMLFTVAIVLALAALLGWVGRLPMFAIQGVRVHGDVSHYNAITLRANVMPRLSGTFFTLDVNVARKAFETMPWVRQAIVRRDFPNRLKVQLQEHQAVAFWGPDGDSRLVNSYGEVFEANVGEIDQDNLPRLNGPDGLSAQVLALHQTLQPMFDPLDLTVDQLELTPRGGWRMVLDTGTEVELGGGTTSELVARTERFLKTVTQATARYQRTPEQLASVDLRHTDGYAMRLAGVTTVNSDDGKKQ